MATTATAPLSKAQSAVRGRGGRERASFREESVETRLAVLETRWEEVVKEGELARLETRLVRWSLGFLVAVIGLGAASAAFLGGHISALGSRTASLEVRTNRVEERMFELNERVSQLRDSTAMGFAAINAKFDSLEAKLTGRVDALEARFDVLETKVDSLETKVDALGASLAELKELLLERR